MGTSRATAHALLEIISQQGGYFTAHQALEVGYAYPEQSYHVAHGNWERVARGIYHLYGYPSSGRDDLIVASLLTVNRAGEPQGIISHESALALHELGDSNPAHIHLTVPPKFRKRLPDNIILHCGIVPKEDRESHEGYQVTTPLRTLLDIAASPERWPLLNSAVADALRLGKVRRSALAEAHLSAEANTHLLAAIAAAEEATHV